MLIKKLIKEIVNIVSKIINSDGQNPDSFRETFKVFRRSKRFSKIWEGSNSLKLYSVEVCFYQTCKFVILKENIR